MKQAYVSLVLLADSIPPLAELGLIDNHLSSLTRAHEIVLVVPAQELRLEAPSTSQGPLSIVMTYPRSSPDSALIAGLARSVGDFIIEWRGPLENLDERLLDEVLACSDVGDELVEITGGGASLGSGFVGFANRFRPRESPLVRTVGRLLSRHALQQLLNASSLEPQVDALVADLPVKRTRLHVAASPPSAERLGHRIARAWSLLVRGTRFGSAVPLVMAVASALFGLAAALYAVGVLAFRGQAPEGWTTLMVVIGLGQAAVLAMLGLTWARIDALTRGINGRYDATADVVVLPPGAFQTRPVTSRGLSGMSHASDEPGEA